MGYNTANCTMKKTHFFAVLFLAATFISTPLLLSSCGGGGGDNGGGSVKSSKKHPKNEVFGNIIALYCQYRDQDSVLRAQFEKDRDKLVEKYAEKPEKMHAEWEKINGQFEAEQLKNSGEFVTIIEKEVEANNLIGKKIPFEQDATDMGFEVTDLVLSVVNPRGGKSSSPSPRLSLEFEGTVKITDISKFNKVFKYEHWFDYTPLDANGNPCTEAHPNKISVEQKDATEATFNLGRSGGVNEKDYLNFAKMKFEKHVFE